MTVSGASVLRLAGLGLLAWLLQLTVVSQITVFGVPADLTPLVVAFVGYITGSTTGASISSSITGRSAGGSGRMVPL